MQSGFYCFFLSGRSEKKQVCFLGWVQLHQPWLVLTMMLDCYHTWS